MGDSYSPTVHLSMTTTTYTKQQHQTHYLQGKSFSISYTIFYQST